MKFIISIIFLALSAISLNTCYNGNAFDITKSENDPDVYVAGYYWGSGENKACYWKDGKLFMLSVDSGDTDSHAQSIFISGKDVYIAGWQNGTACYWKNGEKTDLTGGAYAYSIYVCNGHVYVAGDTTGSTTACYWDNGVRTTLGSFGGATSSASSIYVRTGDVYVTGYYSITGGGTDRYACAWRNGGASLDLRTYPVTDNLTGKNPAYGTGVCGSGVDIFVSGHYTVGANTQAFFHSPRHSGDVPPKPLTADLPGGTTSSVAKSLYYTGTDFYISGNYNNTDGNIRACYWKNEIKYDISSGNQSMANCIYVSDGIYISGANQENSGGNWPACYWVNNNLKNLEGGEDAGANAISVLFK